MAPRQPRRPAASSTSETVAPSADPIVELPPAEQTMAEAAPVKAPARSRAPTRRAAAVAGSQVSAEVGRGVPPIKDPGAKIGVALGGLGGANAFGVGFLVAARAMNVQPAALSCTSGMIYWAVEYFREIEQEKILGQAVRCLEKKIYRHIDDGHPAGDNPYLNFIYALFSGKKGVARFALEEYFRRWGFGPITSPADLMRLMPPLSFEDWADRALPAQAWVRTIPDSWFDDAARLLLKQDIPIYFNALVVKTGTEIVYTNAAGLKAHQQRLLQEEGYGKADLAKFNVPHTRVQLITAQGIKDALWLTPYGFKGPDGRQQQAIDGAYIRQFMLEELLGQADWLLIPRPLDAAWHGKIPSNYFDVQSFQTQLWFNSSYLAQIQLIELVNSLIRKSHLVGGGFREVNLVPIELDVERSYFDYFVESEEIYIRGLQKTIDVLAAAGFTPPAPEELVMCPEGH